MKGIAVLHKDRERLKSSGEKDNSTLGHYSMKTPSNPKAKLFLGKKCELNFQDGSWSGSWSWSGTHSLGSDLTVTKSGVQSRRQD